MKNFIEVVERTHRNVKTGNIVKYTYHAPTHWDSEGFCSIYDNHGKWSFQSSSGGTNSEFSPILVIDAMRQGFEMAQKRLIKLDSDTNRA